MQTGSGFPSRQGIGLNKLREAGNGGVVGEGRYGRDRIIAGRVMLQSLQPISCHLGIGIENDEIPVWVKFRRLVNALHKPLIVLVTQQSHFVCSGECLQVVGNGRLWGRIVDHDDVSHARRC